MLDLLRCTRMRRPENANEREPFIDMWHVRPHGQLSWRVISQACSFSPFEQSGERRQIVQGGVLSQLLLERHAEARLQKRKIGDLFGFEPRQIIVQLFLRPFLRIEKATIPRCKS